MVDTSNLGGSGTRNGHGTMRNFNRHISGAWRLKVRRFGTFLLIVVSVAIVADLPEYHCAGAAIGREIQSMQVRLTEMQSVSYLPMTKRALPIEELKQVIATLELELGDNIL
jgi:hypothetical protein